MASLGNNVSKSAVLFSVKIEITTIKKRKVEVVCYNLSWNQKEELMSVLNLLRKGPFFILCFQVNNRTTSFDSKMIKGMSVTYTTKKIKDSRITSIQKFLLAIRIKGNPYTLKWEPNMEGPLCRQQIPVL